MPLQLQYTVEELKNVGTLTLWAWDERFESTTSKSDSSAVDLAAAAREAWSFSFASPTILSVNMGSAGTSGNPHSNAHIRLPVSADPATGPNGKMDAIFKADHFELRLRTAEASQTTRSRDDLEISHPYTARDFRAHAGVLLVCVACGASLADLRSVTRFNDLPSEHWAELLDAWMCHQDQTLSEELIAKGNNIWPKETQALIGSTGIVLAASNTCNWTVASDLEVSLIPIVPQFPSSSASRTYRVGTIVTSLDDVQSDSKEGQPLHLVSASSACNESQVEARCKRRSG